jgi:hypothetical protein
MLALAIVLVFSTGVVNFAQGVSGRCSRRSLLGRSSGT